MIEFFKAGVLQAPRAVTSAKASDDSEVGFVTPNFDAGSVLLRNTDGLFVRLDWPASERRRDGDAKPQTKHDGRRPLPPGKYTLTNYRIVRRDHDGREWFVSATGKNIRQIEVVAGQTHRFELKPEIAMNCSVKPMASGVGVQAMIMGEHHAGLTIYRDGKRIPMEFVIVDADGKELASGPMNYG